MFLDGRLSAKDLAFYIIAQVLGAIAAAALLYLFVSSFGVYDYTGGLGTNGVDGAGGVGGALIIEAILTFIFILVILAVTASEKTSRLAGIVIGLTLTFVHIVGIPLTGTSVNPARSIGPAIFAGGAALSDLWVFILGPVIGAVLAFCFYRFVVAAKVEGK
jgi:aquaporin Z